MVNPIKFVEEYLELQRDFGISPKVYIHPDCKFVTPWDILANLAELKRTAAYNSTGCGFWKTLERYDNNVYPVSFLEAYNSITYSESSFKDITQYYKKDLDLMAASINMLGLKQHFIDDMNFLSHHVIWANNEVINRYENVIFENGQGLMIGEQYASEKDWEYCTPSNTGVEYAVNMIKGLKPSEFEKKDIEICYISRTYMTRHGDGDILKACDKRDINPMIYDQTNVFNACQGHLRYGLLPVKEMMDNIHLDMALALGLHFTDINMDYITCSLMLTHWNEYHDDNVEALFERFEKIYISDDKTAESVKLKEEAIE